MRSQKEITIGQLGERTGLAASAIRFYESKGLVKPHRNAGGQRRFVTTDIRRLSFVLIAQQLGFSLKQIRDQLDALPSGRAPNQRDWSRMSRRFRHVLDERIGGLERLRDRLDGCIGCGCLSLKKCELYNPEDNAAQLGPGPRHLIES